MTIMNIFKMFLLLPIIVTSMYLANTYVLQQPETLSEPIAKEVDQKQLQCLADNIYHEAGAESTEGKAAVAWVVLNRISHGGFGATPCKVVYQSNKVKQINEETEQPFWVKVCQFSWVCENKKNPNRKSSVYQSSLQVAYDVLAYDKYKEIIPRTVLFFHNKTVITQWPHEVVKVIGNHIFYKKKSKHHDRRKQKDGYKSSKALIQDEKVPKGTKEKSV
jgi:N-acetylmuramoyl-L-alanine amidase